MSISEKFFLLVVPIIFLTSTLAMADVQIQDRQDTKRCFHKQDDGWEKGNSIHQWDCSGGPSENKTWIYDAKTGYIRAKSNPAMCLHKQDDGWENGNNIHLWPNKMQIV